MNQVKNREYEHHGITFKVVPGSAREKLLLAMFQAHDYAAQKPGIIEPETVQRFWASPWWVGQVCFAAGVLIGWWLI